MAQNFDDIINMPKKSLPASTTNSRCAIIGASLWPPLSLLHTLCLLFRSSMSQFSLSPSSLSPLGSSSLFSGSVSAHSMILWAHTSSAVDICARFLRLMSTLRICVCIHCVFLYVTCPMCISISCTLCISVANVDAHVTSCRQMSLPLLLLIRIHPASSFP